MTLKLAFAVLMTSTLMAQGESPQAGAAALKESLARNQQQLRDYSWIETTQVSVKGEVKKEEQKQCYYGADGKVQKTPVAGTPAAPPQQQSGGGRKGGRVKEKVVENKTEETQDYMQKVVALVQQYVPPDPQKIQAAQAAGNVSTQPSGGTVNVSMKDYVKPGDQVTIGLNPTSNQLTSYHVQSFVDKPKEDDVNLDVTFGILQDGTSYPQQILLDAPAKKIQVKVTNSGYKKTGA